MVDSIQIWDSCVSAVIYGGDPEQAQKRFESWCRLTPEGETAVETEIKKIVTPQVPALEGMTPLGMKVTKTASKGITCFELKF